MTLLRQWSDGVLRRPDDRVRAAVGDGILALAGIVGATCVDAGDLFIHRELVKQIGQDGRTAKVGRSDLDGPDLERFLVDLEVDLATNTPLRVAMLASVPFALDFDALAVDQHVEQSLRAAVGHVPGKGLLAAAGCAKIRHSPVEVDQPQQALTKPSRLYECRAEKHLH